MTRNFTTYVGQQGKVLSELTNEEIYVELLNFVKEEAAAKSKNSSQRKVYYIS
ncbi:hypothetical protein HK195_09130, partial [Streptococcus agalactiae]|nr:hypothetical protein [Streptococcus agalactiae]MCC9813290.1 hypothetical protein [Streptococcus agalactiae]MCD0008529.1 hypothetical protein [Streptococcus agalactiae]